MLRFYRALPYRFATQYSGMLRALAAGRLPLVINCAAGKDRTGVAAAVVLASLDVSRDQIVADYTLTDSTVNLEKELFEHPESSLGLGSDQAVLALATKEARAPLLRAAPEYLLAAFEEIETNEGSVDAYLRNQLGLTDEMRESLRNHLLEG